MMNCCVPAHFVISILTFLFKKKIKKIEKCVVNASLSFEIMIIKY